MRLKTETETASWTMLKHSRAEEPGAVYEWIHQHKQHLSLPTVIWSIVIIKKIDDKTWFCYNGCIHLSL